LQSVFDLASYYREIKRKSTSAGGDFSKCVHSVLLAVLLVAGANGTYFWVGRGKYVEMN
jgi:hypothetical protein